MSNRKSNTIIFLGGVVLGSVITVVLSALHSRKKRQPRLITDDSWSSKVPISAENSEDFEAAGNYLLKWLVNYRDNVVHENPVISIVQPNYLVDILPKEAPQYEEYWPKIFKDLDNAIVPGLTNWYTFIFSFLFICFGNALLHICYSSRGIYILYIQYSILKTILYYTIL